jgi:hypothetical protein
LYFACPDQAFAVLIKGEPSETQVFPYFLQHGIVEGKDVLERAVWHTLLTLEKQPDQGKKGLKPTLGIGLVVRLWHWRWRLSSPDEPSAIIVDRVRM